MQYKREVYNSKFVSLLRGGYKKKVSLNKQINRKIKGKSKSQNFNHNYFIIVIIINGYLLREFMDN